MDGGSGTPVPAAHARLLARLGAPSACALGGGAEAVVYALDEARVVRIHRGEPWPAAAEMEQLYRGWRAAPTSFALPVVLGSGIDDGLWWQLMPRFGGQTVAAWLQTVDGADRAGLLERYVDASFEIGSVQAGPGYGPLLAAAAAGDSWADCLRARLAVPDPRSRARLAAHVPGFDRLVESLDERLDRLYGGEPRLVHVDYFPGNVMADRTAGTGSGPGGLRISAVFDFGPHSLYGDPLLDVVGAVVMADISTDVSGAEQRAMAEHARWRAGPRWDAVFDAYRAFYALYYAMDEALLPWCTQQLRAVRLA